METEKRLLLQANGISIVFGGLRAVSGFSCSVREGELIGLIGPNGAGKTTVFNMLSGIYTPTEGEITFWDSSGNVHAVNRQTPARLNRLGIARTFQNIRLFGNLTAADNVRIALHGLRAGNPFDVLFRTPRFYADERMMTERAESLLDLFGIAGKKDELAKNLPYGEQRKLEIARALAAGPSLLLLDEPAAGLDPRTRQDFIQMLKEINKCGKTILISSHILSELGEMCTDIGIIEEGAMVLRGSLVDILAMVNTSNPLEMRIYKNLPEAVALLRRHPLVHNVTIDGNQVVAGFSGGQMDEARLLGQLVTEAGALVGSFGRRQGGLESVFMQITGSKEEKVVAQG